MAAVPRQQYFLQFLLTVLTIILQVFSQCNVYSIEVRADKRPYQQFGDWTRVRVKYAMLVIDGKARNVISIFRSFVIPLETSVKQEGRYNGQHVEVMQIKQSFAKW